MANRKKSKKKVMVFGVFDRLHPGHISFLKQAAAMGDELIVVLARDASVQELKNKKPHHNERERMQAVQKITSVHRVVLGDAELGSYRVVGEYRPDVICLGYDQHGLAEDLKRRIQKEELMSISLVSLEAYEPDVFHTSMI